MILLRLSCFFCVPMLVLSNPTLCIRATYMQPQIGIVQLSMRNLGLIWTSLAHGSNICLHNKMCVDWPCVITEFKARGP